MKEKQYIPFGEEWKKEVKKMTKDRLIEMLRKALIRLKNLKELLLELKKEIDL